MAEPHRLLKQAANLHQSGQIAKARNIYCQVLEKDSANATAWYFLGTIASHVGDPKLAVKLIHQSLTHQPNHPDAYYHLAVAQRALGDLISAQGSLLQALAIEPDHLDANNTLGVVLSEIKKPADAIPFFEKVLRFQPTNVVALSNLGNVINLIGRSEEALGYYSQALAHQPDNVEALNNMGQVLNQIGRTPEALVAFRQALRLRPEQVEVLVNLGAVLQREGELEEALHHLRRAIELKPSQATAFINLGNVYRDLKRFEESAACYAEALRLRPDYALACSNMGTLLQIQGKYADSIPWYRRSIQIDPEFPDAYSNLLFALNFDQDTGPDQLFAEHQAFSDALEPLAPPLRPHGNETSPGRRLRIGYISADFREHALVRFFEPILIHHDPLRFEITCYAEVAHPDAVTERLKSQADHWRIICNFSDHRIAEMIRADGIDILVDLSGHTSGQRLRTFMARPAPVQVTYLGYPNTTGLRSIDYLLTDNVFFPPEEKARCSEIPYRLPNGICTFQPPVTPAVGPLPALMSNTITFGSLHSISKLNDRVLDLWGRLLNSVPNSKLLLYRDTLQGDVREQLLQRLLERGLTEDRLDLRTGPSSGYHSVYHEIDISLDVFPWGSGTTTYESLWMGVPVLTLRGPRPAERGSASALSRLGMTDWITDSADEFVHRGMQHASDLESLALLRSTLRPTMSRTICDGASFTQQLEAAYRTMWKTWCESQAKRLSA